MTFPSKSYLLANFNAQKSLWMKGWEAERIPDQEVSKRQSTALQRNRTDKSDAALSHSPVSSPVNLSSCPYHSLLLYQLCIPSVKQQADTWPQCPGPGLPHITLIPGAEELGDTWNSATVYLRAVYQFILEHAAGPRNSSHV